jgi:hypothetical protein
LHIVAQTHDPIADAVEKWMGYLQDALATAPEDQRTKLEKYIESCASLLRKLAMTRPEGK